MMLLQDHEGLNNGKTYVWITRKRMLILGSEITVLVLGTAFLLPPC